MLVYHKVHQYGCSILGSDKFVQNISTNIWSWDKRTDFKLVEVTSLLISHHITISLLYLPKWFSNYLFIAWQCKSRIFNAKRNIFRGLFSIDIKRVFLVIYELFWECTESFLAILHNICGKAQFMRINWWRCTSRNLGGKIAWQVNWRGYTFPKSAKIRLWQPRVFAEK